MGFGWTLGPPAVVLFGLGLIIPPVVLVIQCGAALRIPTVLLGLVWAGVIGLYIDNHHVGRRAFVSELHDTDLSRRISLEDAYGQWRKAQGDPGANGYTMVLVAVEGGASRAGYWTANVLAALHDDPQGGFEPRDGETSGRCGEQHGDLLLPLCVWLNNRDVVIS